MLMPEMRGNRSSVEEKMRSIAAGVPVDCRA